MPRLPGAENLEDRLGEGEETVWPVKQREWMWLDNKSHTHLDDPAKYIPPPSIPGSLRAPPKSSTTIFGSNRPLKERDGGREWGGAKE